MHATSTCVSQRKQRKIYSHTITNNRAQSMEKDRHNDFAWRYEFVQILNESIFLLFVTLQTDPEWINKFVVRHFAYGSWMNQYISCSSFCIRTIITLNDWIKICYTGETWYQWFEGGIRMVLTLNQWSHTPKPCPLHLVTGVSQNHVPKEVLHLWCASQRKPTDTR